jgi:outer membrane immunogenic protein
MTRRTHLLIGAIMKTFLFAGIGFAALVAAPAVAADLKVKAPVKAPPPAPVYSWTGFYVGLNAGYGWGNLSADIESSDPASAAFLNQAGINGPTFSSSFASSFRQKGGLVGVQAGYNWQFAGNWVAGFETDIQYAHIKDSFSNRIFLQPGFFGTNFPFDLNSERKLDWFGTVRGRLGVLLYPNVLVYGTAGLAYGHTQGSGSIVLAPPPGSANSVNFPGGGLTFSCAATGPATATCYSGSNSRTSVGWTAGAGFEVNLWSNVTAKLEYLHVDLGGQTVTLVSPPPSTPGVFLGYRFNQERVDIVRVGVNYAFGGPVVAKY